MNTNKFIPAFPTWIQDDSMAQGMSLRDYFAATALTTQMMYSPDEVDSEVCYVVAKMAYKIADAMMEARK
jgi:hypothetical protein